MKAALSVLHFYSVCRSYPEPQQVPLIWDRNQEKAIQIVRLFFLFFFIVEALNYYSTIVFMNYFTKPHLHLDTLDALGCSQETRYTG